jgi:hypothetical protein
MSRLCLNLAQHSATATEKERPVTWSMMTMLLATPLQLATRTMLTACQ